MGSAKTMDEIVQQSAVSMARRSELRTVLGRSRRVRNWFSERLR